MVRLPLLHACRVSRRPCDTRRLRLETEHQRRADYARKNVAIAQRLRRADLTIKVGEMVRYQREDIEAWLAARKGV
jgi:hypothetical protein